MNAYIKQIGLFAACNLALVASTHASTFADITIDGGTLGGGITDWAGISPIFTGANDINEIYMANNATNLFILITFNSEINPNSGSGLYLGFDNDSNVATGLDVYGKGLFGSEAAYQNNFPFEQATGVFNTSAPTDAAIGMQFRYNTSTTYQEFSISRSAIIDTVNGDLMFPNDSFNFVAYFDDGDEDISATVSYTFAAVPEPSQAALLLSLGALALTVARRKRNA